MKIRLGSWTRWCGMAAAGLALTVAPEALARDNKPKNGWVPEPLRSDIGLEFGVWPSDQGTTVTTVPMVLFGHNEVVPNVVLDLYLPGTFTVASQPIFSQGGDGAKTIAGIGNPTLFVRYAKTRGVLTWTVGGGLSAPLAALKQDKLRAADVLASSATGYYDAYLWATPVFPIDIIGAAEIRVLPQLAVRLSLEPSFFIPLESVAATQINFFERIEGEYRAKNGFCAGLALYGATVIPNNVAVHEQLSLKPFIGYDDTESFFVRGGALLALNDPLGPGFNRGKVLSGVVSIGGYLGGGGSDDDD